MLSCDPHFARGFTLIETCMVLLILAILMGVLVPAMRSAFIENSIRSDSRELEIMVKAATIRSTDRQQTYVLDLTSTSMALHVAGQSDDGTKAGSGSAIHSLDSANRLEVRDPKKPSAWITMAPATWLFEAGKLSRNPEIRVAQGRAWIALTFNPLTGDLDREEESVP
jgi:prepilin-type N-terminal cleavage/methylation domain-containing protein